ncbi:hypothetical protein DVH05_017952 [Phytophthora capsici]|nr:hypothetical protein DVH05_017952 [Phytophthora capsici]
MRLHYIVVLAVVAFVTNGNTVSADKSRVAITGNIDTPPTRLLRTQYTDEERGFGLNLLPGSKKISSFMTDKKLSKYLKSNQEFDDVFIKLKLNKAGDKLFENPKFLAWAQYVDDFNQKHQTQNSMLPTLVRQFGGDDLSIMLEKAKQTSKTYDVAWKLEGEQMKLWKREGLTTDMLFRVYKLDDWDSHLLVNPGINIWMRYADELFPGDSTLLFKKLQKTYSDEALSKIFITGKKIASTKKLASDLQSQQLRLWLDSSVPPKKVFQLLSLNQRADDVLRSPQLQTWFWYNAAYAKQNPNARKVTLVDTLLENFDTAAMVSLIRTRPNTIYGRRYASRVERGLIKRWVADGKP